MISEREQPEQERSLIKTQPALDPEKALLALRNIDALARKMLGASQTRDKSEWSVIRRWLAEAGLVDQGITQ